MDIIDEIKAVLPQLDPIFERGVWALFCGHPYLTDSLWRLILQESGGAIACTSPIMDCLAAESLRYERDPGTRGFCFAFVRHPETLGRETCWTATIHEAAHFLEDKSAARDNPNEAEAIKSFWSDPSIRHNEHSRTWCQAALHMAYRAKALGIPVSTAELLASAGLNESFMAGLRSEIVSRVDEPIENILEGSRSAVPQQQAAVRRNRPWPRADVLNGIPVKRHADGGVETLPDLLGRGGGRRYASAREFLKAIEV